MNDELDNMPEGARRAAEHIAQLIEIMKHQSERITVLEKHVFVLLQRLEQNETSWLELSEKIAKSTIKIDTGPSGLGLN